MTEKTDELRDIFITITDEKSVTESQAETKGSLVTEEGEIDEQLEAVVERLRERFSFRTSLDDATIATVVRSYFAGEDDAAIADLIGRTEREVFVARLDCHLLRDADVPDGVDVDALREQIEDPLETDSPSTDELAAAVDADPEAVERARHVVAARARARSVSHRFRAEFEDALADAGLSDHLTESVREDGLAEATEDIGSLEEDADVGF